MDLAPLLLSFFPMKLKSLVFLFGFILAIPVGASAQVSNPDDAYERLRLTVARISEKIAQESGNSGFRIELSKIIFQGWSPLGGGTVRYGEASAIFDVYNARPGDKLDLTELGFIPLEWVQLDIDNGFGVRLLGFQHDTLEPGVSSNALEVVGGSLRLRVENATGNFQLKLLGRIGVNSWSGLQVKKPIEGCPACSAGGFDSWIPTNISVGFQAQLNIYRTFNLGYRHYSISGNRNHISESLSKNAFDFDADLGHLIRPLPDDQLFFVGGLSKIKGEMDFFQAPLTLRDKEFHNRRITYGVRWIVPKFWKR